LSVPIKDKRIAKIIYAGSVPCHICSSKLYMNIYTADYALH